MSKILFVRLTTKCNASCKMCSVWKRKPIDFEYHELISIIDFFSKREYKNIIFTGGEPTLYPKFNTLNKYLFKNNLKFGIITNGSVINKKWNYLFEYKKPSMLIFSLDGKDEYHSKNRNIIGLVNKVIAAIKKAQKIKIKISVNTVITNKNYNQVLYLSNLDVIKNANEWHWVPVKFNISLRLNKLELFKLFNLYKKINLENIISIFNFEENINYDNLASGKYTLDYYSKNDCLICNKMIFIDLEGKVYRCNSFDKRNKYTFFGNYKKENLNILYSKINSNKEIHMPQCINCDPRNQRYNKKGVLFENYFN